MHTAVIRKIGWHTATPGCVLLLIPHSVLVLLGHIWLSIPLVPTDLKHVGQATEHKRRPHHSGQDDNIIAGDGFTALPVWFLRWLVFNWL